MLKHNKAMPYCALTSVFRYVVSYFERLKLRYQTHFVLKQLVALYIRLHYGQVCI